MKAQALINAQNAVMRQEEKVLPRFYVHFYKRSKLLKPLVTYAKIMILPKIRTKYGKESFHF